jgi:hypothetical protein
MKDGVNPRGDARRSARLVRLAERTSFVVGAVCLTLYCAACVHSSMSQSKEQRAFDPTSRRSAASTFPMPASP